MQSTSNELQRRLSGVCLIVAPAIGLVSEALRYGWQTVYFSSGVLALAGMALSMQGLLGLRHLLSAPAPRLAIYGCGAALVLAMSGSAIISVYLVTPILSPAAAQGASIDPSVFARLFPVIFLPGLLYLLLRAFIGIGMWRAGVVPAWIGVLHALGYFLFPVGRIPFFPFVVYTAATLVLITEAWIGWRILTVRGFWNPAGRTP